MKDWLRFAFTILLPVSAIGGIIVWVSSINPYSPTFSWTLRIASLVVFPGSLAGLFYLASLPESVPDFLSRLREPRIGRDGVLFVFECAARDGWTWIDIHYQNRYTNSAQVSVAFTPSQNFLMKRNDIDPIAVTFPCGPAAYGIIHVPIAMKQEYQGQSQKFDVASKEEYANGKGDCLRDIVGDEISKLDRSYFNSAGVKLASAVLTGGLPNIRWQSRVKVMLPQGVSESTNRMPSLIQDEQWTLADRDAANTKS
jgi:hypothetical protein